MYSFITYNNLLINEAFFDLLKNIHLADFHSLMNLKGDILLKKNKFRSVTRIERGGKVFFLKKHFWPLKKRINAIIPFVKKEDARNEWRNMLLLNSLGFHTMTPVAFGEKRRFGIPYFSLTLTENIYDCEKLEVYLPKHFPPPLTIEQVFHKRELIKKLSILTKDFHNKGLNHQDFYLGHLFIRPKDGKIFIVDVQRMHKNNSLSVHDMVKDLSQLTYSAYETSVFTRTDFLRFFHLYLDREKLTRSDKQIIKKILLKVKKISRHDAKLKKRKQAQNRPAYYK